jgi:hypothetical protein
MRENGSRITIAYRNSSIGPIGRKPDFGMTPLSQYSLHAFIQRHRENRFIRSFTRIIALAPAGFVPVGKALLGSSAQRARHTLEAAFLEAVSAHVD